jgi:hypothetical protein
MAMDDKATHLLALQVSAELALLHPGLAQIWFVAIVAQVADSPTPAWQVPVVPVPTQ